MHKDSLSHLFALLIAVCFSFAAFNASAAEESAENAEGTEEEAPKKPVKYYQIAPNIMTFYQNTGRKMGYIVVQVQLVVRGDEDWDIVDENLPLIQDALIDFFNRQQESVVRDLAQRDALRVQAKDIVATALKEELGREVVENLLFTQYLFQ